MSNDRMSIQAWLDAFAAAVRAADVAAGRRFFSGDVVAFGSIEKICRGLDALESDQWRNVWPCTSDYQLKLIDCGASGELAWAATTWSSLGRAAGATFTRSGRATFVLQRQAGTWLAVHSHHSFDPDQKPRR